ncbi:MAG: 5-methyltetrahydropteroyltriglutamate--homocysteine methyltransferase [Streptosporangiaceae bacterium]
MSDYDPRTSTGIPAEPVGSLPRPTTLQDAYAAYDAGSISREQLEARQEEAVRDSLARYAATDAPIISDGEQRWSSFATYAITDTLAGTGLADHLAGGGQYFAIFADGHGRQLPKLTGGPFRYKNYAADSLRKSIPLAGRPMKQAVIAPSMLALLYPLDEEVPGYPREQFEEDLVSECEKDIRAAFAAGAARISIGFTEGRLATRNDHRNPWTGRGLLPHFIELNNRVLARFSADERASIGEHSREDADGVAQMCCIGIINPLNPRVESPQEVHDALVRASNFIPRERLGSTDDCGFSPFSIDEKPNHGSPDFARDVAFQKIANRVEGTRRAAETLGVS